MQYCDPLDFVFKNFGYHYHRKIILI